MDVAAKDATDSAETVDVVDVTADADAATTDVASAITAACGSSFFSVAAAVSATAVDAATTDVATTAACGSSFFSAAVVVSATDADAAMAVDADARQHNISCIGLKRRSHFSVSFFIYIYNADPGIRWIISADCRFMHFLFNLSVNSHPIWMKTNGI